MDTPSVARISPFADRNGVPHTAENLLRYLAAFGCGNAAIGVDLVGPTMDDAGNVDPAASDRYHVNVYGMLWAHDVHVALAALAEVDPAKADEVADRLILSSQAGDSHGEWLWQWCEEHGLDAEAIAAEAAATLTEAPQ